MFQVTHRVNMLRTELHPWAHAWLYKKLREGLGHSLTFLLRQSYSQKHTPGRSTDLFRIMSYADQNLNKQRHIRFLSGGQKARRTHPFTYLINKLILVVPKQIHRHLTGLHFYFGLKT